MPASGRWPIRFKGTEPFLSGRFIELVLDPDAAKGELRLYQTRDDDQAMRTVAVERMQQTPIFLGSLGGDWRVAVALDLKQKGVTACVYEQAAGPKMIQETGVWGAEEE